MKRKIVWLMLASAITLVAVNAYSKTPGHFMELFQNDLLGEYEQRLVLIEKQFAEFKKRLTPEKMSTLDVKMKIGSFENNRNSLKAKLRDLRKAGTVVTETDKGDIDKKFEKLTTEFEQLKKLTD